MRTEHRDVHLCLSIQHKQGLIQNSTMVVVLIATVNIRLSHLIENIINYHQIQNDPRTLISS